MGKRRKNYFQSDWSWRGPPPPPKPKRGRQKKKKSEDCDGWLSSGYRLDYRDFLLGPAEDEGPQETAGYRDYPVGPAEDDEGPQETAILDTYAGEGM